jgi:hypothetical protein
VNLRVVVIIVCHLEIAISDLCAQGATEVSSLLNVVVGVLGSSVEI